jgi:peptide/nickel transport system substrate-binding protein/oligopeptide transport system substrate-binding protein
MEPEKTLKIAIESDPRTLDPAYVTDTYSGMAVGMIYSNLLRFDETGQIALDVAKYYSISENGRSYTFFLKENCRFADGTDLTADDVSFSLHRLAARSTDSPRSGLLEQVVGFDSFHSGKSDIISGIKVLSRFRIQIELKRPFSPFLSIFAMPNLAIVSRSYVMKGGEMEETGMGAGPYRLKRWERGQELCLVTNDYYSKKGNLEAIQLKIMKDAFSRLAELKGRRIHVMEVLPQYRAQIPDTVNLKSIEQYNLYFLGMNMKSEMFKNPDFRKGLAMALDRASILDFFLKGQGTLATGPVPKGLSGYLDEELLKYDPELAKQFIEKSGYDGEQLKLVCSSDPANVALGEIFKQQFKKVGVHIRIVPRDWNAYTQQLIEGDFDLFYRNWVADYPDGDNFLYPLFHTDSAGAAGNYPNYSNPEFDSLMEDSRKEMDPLRRTSLLKQASRMAVNDYSRILLWYKVKTLAVDSRVQNFKPHAMYNSNRYLTVNLLTK